MHIMAEARKPPDVKLICGMVSADTGLFDQARGALERRFGEADLLGEIMDFDFTHYYDGQMGSPLYRRFVSFATLMNPRRLVPAKLATNAIEREFARRSSSGQARPINLDPGYVEESKLVLASMKPFSHRIYLARGVWAEVTLMYRKGAWEPLEWTFPDYASGRYDAFLSEVRSLLRDAKSRKESRS